MLKLKSAWFKYKCVHIVKTQSTQKRNNIMLGSKSKSFVLNITARFDESPPPPTRAVPQRDHDCFKPTCLGERQNTGHKHWPARCAPLAVDTIPPGLKAKTQYYRRGWV